MKKHDVKGLLLTKLDGTLNFFYKKLFDFTKLPTTTLMEIKIYSRFIHGELILLEFFLCLTTLVMRKQINFR